MQHPALLFVLVYFAVQIVFRTNLSSGAGVDDAEQLAYMGALEWGYGGSQAPLYTWINSIAGSMLGINMFTLFLIKFSMLASMFCSVYFGARLLGMSKSVAAAGMLGLFLLPQIAWESQRTLTHSVAGTTGCAWAFLAFAWHMKSKTRFSAILLGLGLAAGFLGKFNASFFLAGILMAGLSVAFYRSVLLSRKSVWIVAAFLVAVLPTGFWTVLHMDNLLSRSGKFQMNEGGQFFISRLQGEWKLLRNSVLFSGVALVALAVTFWPSYTARASRKDGWSDGEKLVARILLFSLVTVAIGVLVSGASEVKDRWLQPVLFLTPLFFSVLLGRLIATDLPLKRFAMIGVLCGLAVMPVMVVNIVYARNGDAPSIGQLDYGSLFSATRAEGDYRTVVSNSPQLPGNLRLFDTSITPVHPEMPNAASRIQFPALFVWFGDAMEPSVSNLLQGAGVSTLPTDIKHLKLSYKYYPEHSETVSYFIVTAK